MDSGKETVGEVYVKVKPDLTEVRQLLLDIVKVLDEYEQKQD